MIQKSETKDLKKGSPNCGMTYIEMIVVLGIFSVLSSVAMFNYNGFQDHIDIKNLGSDIALQVIKAQSDSRAGTLTPLAPLGWKPSYGLYFEAGSSQDQNFIYFADYNNDGIFNNSGVSMDCSGECLEKISLTKGNRISDLFITSSGFEGSTPDTTMVFSRTSAEPIISSGGDIFPNAEIKITAESPKGLKAFITVSASGKMEVQ
jgi:prepilin-type N-terminal cleavage/methylation domain-containing protein